MIHEWILGIPSEHQLAIHSSRLWLEKCNGELTHHIVELLPQCERVTWGKDHCYYTKTMIIKYQGEIVWNFTINEWYRVTVKRYDEIMMVGDIVQDKNDIYNLFQIEKEMMEDIDSTERHLLYVELAKIQEEIKAPNFFAMTLERKSALLHRREYHAIDEDGNKCHLDATVYHKPPHSLPTNYTWWPQKVFLFQHGQMIATFNQNSGELGIACVINGEEPEFVWKFNKPKDKPTHFARLEDKIIL